MKKMVISVDDANRQFAFVKGNRPTNSKVVKAKERSIKAYGQLSPVTVVNGEKVTEIDASFAKDVFEGEGAVVKKGKKTFRKVTIS